MTTETKARKTKTYTDKDGNEIPSTYIHKIDKEKHSAALKLHKRAVALSSQLGAFKAEAFELSDSLYSQMLNDNKITVKDNTRGGYSLSTIDKGIKIEVSVSETITFDERIDMAQSVIKEYLQEVTKGADQSIIILIDEAFKTRKGRLDTKRVLGLLKLNITHVKWTQAMELIKQSMQANNSKRYMRIFERQPDGNYKQIPLDFSSIKTTLKPC